MTGSALAGSTGFNAQFANIVAAIFLATGQDPAHIVEGSLGITTAEVVRENLYVSVYLPDLMIGTVGGGTGLATQKEALSILGITGGDKGKNAEILAKIIGGTVLAGEISLLASLAEGSLVKAHKKLGRGEKI
jgi:hydroxymethylglutaryl-CoA reductase (NADPH)